MGSSERQDELAADSRGDVASACVARQVGQVIRDGVTLADKYEILGLIGRGGMAEVWLAVARGPSGFNKLVVLKVVLPEFSGDDEIRATFEREAQVAGRLNHPNVVHTIETGQHQGRPMLVMEYLRGQSLCEILRKFMSSGSRLPIEIGVRVIQEALEGLHYVHTLKDYDGTSLGLVHRDVSPQSIFVTYDGSVKLLDFGLVLDAEMLNEQRKKWADADFDAYADADLDADVNADAGVAGGGSDERGSGGRQGESKQYMQGGEAGESDFLKPSWSMLGKAAYMAPEQIAGGSIDHRVDIYAMGVVLWQLLTGEVWWKGKHDAQILYEGMHGLIPLPSQVCDNVPPELEQVCIRALQFDPGDRYPTAMHMYDALEAAIARYSPVSVRRTGAFVASLFANERDALNKELEDRLRDIVESSDRKSRLAPTVSRGKSKAAASVGSRSSKRRVVWSIGVSVGVMMVLMVALYVVAPKPGKGAVALGPAASSGELASAAGSSGVFETTEVPLHKDDCSLVIRVVPSHARLYVQGELVEANPATLRVPCDGKTYDVRASASGFEDKGAQVAATGDVAFLMELKELGGVRIGSNTGNVKASAAGKGKVGVHDERVDPSVTTDQPSDKEDKSTKPAVSASPWDQNNRSVRDRIHDVDLSNPW